jgi:hypothetical protein
MDGTSLERIIDIGDGLQRSIEGIEAALQHLPAARGELVAAEAKRLRGQRMALMLWIDEHRG